jgi:hypothetical protein
LYTHSVLTIKITNTLGSTYTVFKKKVAANMQAVIECSLRHVLALQVPRDGAAHAAGISYNNYAINLKTLFQNYI